MSDYDLYCGDCLEVMQDLIDKEVKVDMVLTDPPYGTIKGLGIDGYKNRDISWDNALPTEPMLKYCEKLLRLKGTLILFSQEPYTSQLRTFNYPNLVFTYPLYWFKDHFANGLTSKKAPVSYVEDLSVFRKEWDMEKTHPLREYFLQCQKDSGMSTQEFNKLIGTKSMANHYFTGGIQFQIPTKEKYEKLQTTGYFPLPFSKIKEIDNDLKASFNLQEGKKYKSNVLEYPKSYNHYHPTEKPVPLLKDLILTYTNTGDNVLDFTMGSGSTGVACMQTNRDFIGIELDKEYYKIAEQRIKEANQQTRLM